MSLFPDRITISVIDDNWKICLIIFVDIDHRTIGMLKVVFALQKQVDFKTHVFVFPLL